MRLTFPNGEHAAVHIEQGQVGVGSAAGGGTTVSLEGLAPLHAVFSAGRRGAWLTVPQDARVILNARPVKRLAFLRAGDLVCLGAVQVRIESDQPPAEPGDAASPRTGMVLARPVAPKAVLRGLNGRWFGRCVPLSVPRSIGSGAGNDVRVDAPGVLERHAVIEVDGGELVLRAAAPTAVLRVNGHAVRSARVGPGDQVEVGEQRFGIESPGSAEAREGVATGVPRSAPTPAGRSPAALEPAPVEPPRDLGGLYLLIAAAAALAAALTAFLVYAPRG